MGPPGVVLQEELESVQKRAARFVTGNYNYETGSMTGILGQLKWESLKKRRKDNRLILLYKGLNRYINSQKKRHPRYSTSEKEEWKRFAQSDLEKAEEFNGQFTDVFNKNEHTQARFWIGLHLP